MTKDTVENKMLGIVADNFDVLPETIQLNTKLIEDLKADSLDMVEMLIATEDEFNICVEDSEVEDVKTINDIVEVVCKRLAIT